MSLRKKAALVAAIQLLAIFTIVSTMPMISVVGESVPPQVNGDWIIPANTTQTYWGGTCNITGSLIIETGAILTLHKATVQFNPAFHGSSGVQVVGTMNAYDSRFLSGNGNWYYFDLSVLTSIANLLNNNISDLTYMGIGSGNVVFDGNDLHTSNFGIYTSGQAQPKIKNNTFYDIDNEAIWVENSLASVTGNTIRNSNIAQDFAAVMLYQGRPTFEGNIITGNTGAGLQVIDINNQEVRDCVFNNQGATDIKADYFETTTSVKAYNTSFSTVGLNTNFQDGTASFENYWTVDVYVDLESDSSPVENAKVDVKKMDGTNIVSNKLTNSNGFVLDLEVPEYEMSNNGASTTTDDFKPHVVWATFDLDQRTISSNRTVDIDDNMQINVTLDDLSPILEIDDPLDGHITNDTTVEFNGRTEPDVILRIKNDPVPVDIDGTFTADVKLSEGNNPIKVVSTDPSGNPTEITVNVRRDTFAPKVTIQTPQNGTTTGNPNPFVAGTAEYGSDLWVNDKIVQVLPDGAFNTSIRLAEGENTIRAISKDAVNNTGMHEIIVFLDSVPPVLTIVEPVDGRKTNDLQVLVMGVTEKSAVVTINGQPVTLQGASFKYTVNLVEGENNIIVEATDENNNKALQMVTVHLDTMPPDVDITFPPDLYETNQDTVLVVGVTEPGATVKVGGLTADNIGGAFSKEVKLGTSQNKVIVVVTDEMGNSASKEVHVFKDNIPPDLMVQNPKDGTVLNKRSIGKVEVRGTTEDGATVYVNGERASVSGTTFQLWVYLGDGNNSIEVSAHDPAGNVETKLLFVEYDSHVEYQILTPADGLTTGANMVGATGFVEPGGSVMVNGDGVNINEKGGFNHDVSLKDGRNTITFVFTDESGNEETITRYVTKEVSGTQDSASSLPLSILFIVVIVVLIAVMAVFLMKGRRPKPVEEVAGDEPPPPELGPGMAPPPSYGEDFDPNNPPPPSPEIYQQQEGYDQGYDQGYDTEGYDQGYDQTYDQGYDEAPPEAAPEDLGSEAEAEPLDSDEPVEGSDRIEGPFEDVEEPQPQEERALGDRTGESEADAEETSPEKDLDDPDNRKDILDDILKS